MEHDAVFALLLFIECDFHSPLHISYYTIECSLNRLSISMWWLSLCIIASPNRSLHSYRFKAYINSHVTYIEPHEIGLLRGLIKLLYSYTDKFMQISWADPFLHHSIPLSFSLGTFNTFFNYNLIWGKQCPCARRSITECGLVDEMCWNSAIHLLPPNRDSPITYVFVTYEFML